MKTRSHAAADGQDGPGALYGGLGWGTDYSNVRRYVARGRRLQVETITAALRSAFGSLRGALTERRARLSDDATPTSARGPEAA